LLCSGCDFLFFFFSSRRRHTSSLRDWSSDVCSSDLETIAQSCGRAVAAMGRPGPGVRRRRAPFAGKYCPLRAGHDGVRGVGGAEIGRASCRERGKRWEGGAEADKERTEVEQEEPQDA